MSKLTQTILSSNRRKAMPIGVYSGLEITGATVKQAVSSAEAQFEAVCALGERFHSQFMLTAMDLSAEAEVFGCQIRMDDAEIPTVVGRRVKNAADLAALPDPQPGDARTAVHLETARRLVNLPGRTVPVLGGMIGPFSLAGRLFGVSEALELSIADPDLLTGLLEKVTNFLAAYAIAFARVGVSGVIMAEPAAGLLSPRALARFSAPYVKRIIEETESPDFTVVLHNCGAKIVHFNKILESGAKIYHFGAPMDITAALSQTPGETIVCGNLDPTAVFHAGTPDSVYAQASDLLKAARHCRNFVISSGCDLPPGTPVANLDAFYQAVADSEDIG